MTDIPSGWASAIAAAFQTALELLGMKKDADKKKEDDTTKAEDAVSKKTPAPKE